jgi:hypothetical protein
MPIDSLASSDERNTRPSICAGLAADCRARPRFVDDRNAAWPRTGNLPALSSSALRRCFGAKVFHFINRYAFGNLPANCVLSDEGHGLRLHRGAHPTSRASLDLTLRIDLSRVTRGRLSVCLLSYEMLHSTPAARSLTRQHRCRQD